MTDALSKEEIVESIKIAQAKGFTIVANEWGDVETKCACALSCVMLVRGHDLPQDVEDVENALSLDYDWITDFAEGFDEPNEETFSDAARLGQEIRREVGPAISKSKWVIDDEIE